MTLTNYWGIGVDAYKQTDDYRTKAAAANREQLETPGFYLKRNILAVAMEIAHGDVD